MLSAERAKRDIMSRLRIEPVLHNRRLDLGAIEDSLEYGKSDVGNTQSADLAWDVGLKQRPGLESLLDSRQRRMEQQAVDIGTVSKPVLLSQIG
jgi:hypothetical protein